MSGELVAPFGIKRFERKNQLSAEGGGGGVSRELVAPFGIKIKLDSRTKKSKKCLILYARFERKNQLSGEGRGGVLKREMWESTLSPFIL